MTNRYLTKIAKNRFETYLASQPEDKKFSNAKVQRAHTAIKDSDRAKKISWMMNDIRADPKAVEKYRNMSRDILRNHRGKSGLVEKGSPNKSFQHLFRGAQPEGALGKRLDNFKNPKTLLGLAKKHPGKAGLVGLAAVGSIGYGVNKLTQS